MKKIFVLFAFMSLASVAINAQSCSHAKKNTSTTATTAVDSEYAKTVAAAAEMDKSIEQKVCAHSGSVSYSRKNVNASGEVTYTDVAYDAATQKFVNVSPSDAAASGKKAGCCAAPCAKSCAKPSSASSETGTGGGAVKMVKSEE